MYTLRNHKHKGFDILVDNYVLQKVYAQTKICPICGCLLKPGNGKCHAGSPTLDRITNKEGALTLEDVWIICHKCNTSKQQFTLSEWKDYAEKVCKRFGVI